MWVIRVIETMGLIGLLWIIMVSVIGLMWIITVSVIGLMWIITVSVIGQDICGLLG